MDYSNAASYWEEKDKNAVQMESSALSAEIERFILAHNTCALATGFDEFVRCTPIEYNYKDGKLWLFSEGGLKFRALEKNQNVCLAIFDSYSGFGNIGGMQISGIAQIIEPWSDEYLDMLAFKKIPVESFRKLPHPMYLIRITPIRIDFLWSEFKKMGYDVRQHLSFEP